MDGSKEFATKIKQLEQELTALKSVKKISSTVSVSVYPRRELPSGHNMCKITYKEGDQPIITEVIGSRFAWMIGEPIGNVQYIKLADNISEYGTPSVYSTREIIKVEAL